MSQQAYRPTWNPLGTSNSEYGKFIYQNSFPGPSRSGGEFGGWNQGQDQPQGYHLPKCQNYNQDHQHHPTCPNANAHSEGNEGGQPEYTVHYGEEAAAKALGEKGLAEFQAQFGNQSQNNQYVSQTGLMKGVEMNGGQKNAAPLSTSRNEPCEQQNQPDVSNYTELSQQATPEVASGGEGDVSPQQEALNPNIQPAKPQPNLPAKWKGLPPSIQYGRQIRPTFSGSQVQMTQPFKVRETGSGDNTSGMKMSAKAAKPKWQSSISTRTPAPVKKSSQKIDPSLCGKCPKCVKYLPSTNNGPSIMNFPSNSSASLKQSVRSRQSFGQQGGKNFRAVQYHPGRGNFK